MEQKSKFGTAPVFFTAISTILGAVMFLRFGFSVGALGLASTIGIILIGHAVTIPTAMAIAEIATNQKVEGGGEYYIISRSFGLVIGSTIGVALYFSQAISVAFYIIAFTEALNPFFAFLHTKFIFAPWLDWLLRQSQTVAIPALIGLTAIVLTKGAELGVKALYIVVATLVASLIAFFFGSSIVGEASAVVTTSVFDKPSFFTVFAIIFPAFTGMTAGVGLSGDLKDAGKSIPMGTLAATLGGMVIYIFMAYKLYNNATPEQLIDTSRLVMSDIAFQGWWLIPLGLAAATISSALGSILVAPRTLQAISRDNIIPLGKLNSWFAKGRGKNDEPYNASLMTVAIALVFILMGALDAVAEIISMFFMVTYGSLCLISFLQHFAADPSYRPRFKSQWYISLFGALACFGLMFFMNPGYALGAVIMIILIYFVVSFYNGDKKNIALIFQGVIFQISRKIHVFLQKADKEDSKSWRPSAIFLSKNTFTRMDSFYFTNWISYKYGFGTFIHHIDGYLSKSSNQEALATKDRLIKIADSIDSEVYVDAIVNHTFSESISQVIQLPSISGTENNLMLFDFKRDHPEELESLVENFKLIQSVNFDVGILSTSDRNFGLRKEIHVWITGKDFDNANLMILMAYVISAHPDWKRGEIKVISVFPEKSIENEKDRMLNLVSAGQLPISPNNIEFIVRDSEKDIKTIIKERSQDADLLILGFVSEVIKRFGTDVFNGYEGLSNILFINTEEGKQIK